ncbi:MAG: nucleotide exchange factor GrpE [Alphaproteobacteria bacterium]
MNQTEQKSGKVATEPGAAAGESEEAKVEAAEPAAAPPANSDVQEGGADGAVPLDVDDGLIDLGPDEVLTLLKDEIATLRDQMLRALADAENTRRRAERDKQDIAKFAVSDFARDMLAAADNLRRALDAVPDDLTGESAVLANLREGVDATERQLLSSLEKHSITRIDPLDEKFDPNFHQAMFEVPGSGKPPGTVVQVIQAGYTIHGRLLRPALVGVAKAEPAQKVDTTA